MRNQIFPATNDFPHFELKLFSSKLYSIHQLLSQSDDEGLTLEKSAFELTFMVATLRYNSVDNTKSPSSKAYNDAWVQRSILLNKIIKV